MKRYFPTFQTGFKIACALLCSAPTFSFGQAGMKQAQSDHRSLR